MACTIEFFGVMLFTCTGGAPNRLRQVLLPAAAEDKSWGSKRGTNEHPSGGAARPHHAGMYILKSGTVVERVPLRGTRVEITERGATEAPEVDFEGLPVLPKSGQICENKATASVLVTANRLTQDRVVQTSTDKFQGRNVTHYTASIAAPGGAHVRVISRSGAVTFEGDVDEGAVWIYSYEEETPEKETLERFNPCDTTMVKDDDFCWLYSLFCQEPVDMPVPQIFCNGASPANASSKKETISVFTCFPATMVT